MTTGWFPPHSPRSLGRLFNTISLTRFKTQRFSLAKNSRIGPSILDTDPGTFG
jgi:hypothetical protein